MDDDRKQGEEGELGSELVLPDGDTLHIEATSDESDAEFDGLETDDRQSAEIREIFGTTFPQYLQPVEEIIEQALAGEADEETTSALSGMLSSLMEASSRMGFENVFTALNQLRESISFLEDAPGMPVPDENREAIIGNLLDLKDLAEELGGDITPPEGGQTIISALKNQPGIGQLVLRRLSAAGLVTVDQLLSGRPEEIAVVSGLDRAIVDQVLSILKNDAEQTSDSAASLAPRPRDSAEIAAPLADMGSAVPPEIEALHEQVLGSLRTEVDSQAAVEELRAEIRALRTKINEQRAELDMLARARKKKRQAAQALTNQIAVDAKRVDELIAARDMLARKFALLEEEKRQKEYKLEALRDERRRVERETNRLCDEVGGLVNRLGKIRRTVAKKRSTR